MLAKKMATSTTPSAADEALCTTDEKAKFSAIDTASDAWRSRTFKGGV